MGAEEVLGVTERMAARGIAHSVDKRLIWVEYGNRAGFSETSY